MFIGFNDGEDEEEVDELPPVLWLGKTYIFAV